MRNCIVCGDIIIEKGINKNKNKKLRMTCNGNFNNIRCTFIYRNISIHIGNQYQARIFNMNLKIKKLERQKFKE